jgi:ABC-type uncharacterized transport system substrate-binding protein
MFRRDHGLTRRQFAQRVMGVGAATVAAGGLLSACGALASSPSRASVPRIGYLRPTTWPETRTGWVKDGLALLGYAQDLDERSAADDAGLRAQADQLVAAKVAVIIAGGHQAIRAAMAATRTIPIVMAADGDPVGTGLIASLARPGGNVTGLSLLSVGLSRKRLEIYKQAVPTLKRVGVLFDPGALDKQHDMEETKEGAQLLGLEAVPVPFRAGEGGDMPTAWAAVTREHGRLDAILTILDDFLLETTALAWANQLPSMCEGRAYPAGGGLMSFGPAVATWFPRAAQYVDRILKGARPADLPVEQPSEFELVINLTTARALGLTIPDAVVAMATVLL